MAISDIAEEYWADMNRQDPEDGTVPFTVHMDPRTKAVLRNLADVTGTSMTRIASELLRDGTVHLCMELATRMGKNDKDRKAIYMDLLRVDLENREEAA